MVKKWYYRNDGLSLAWDFKRSFSDVPNLWFVGLKKIILNLGLKGVMEKYVGCFLVYSFLGVLKLAFFL